MRTVKATATWMAVLVGMTVPAAGQEVDSGAVQKRLPAELQCLRKAHARLGETVRLLRQSHAQMRASDDERVTRDAARAVVALEERIRELLGEMERCTPDDAGGEKVAHVEPDPDPAEEAVAEPNPAVQVVERDRALGPHVHVVAGQKVDGKGTLPDRAVQGAVTRAAGALHACYDRLVERGALQKGELSLLFTVTGVGHVRGVDVERSSLGGPAFARCVELGARRVMRVDTRPSGGSVSYGYTLRFGPD
ncbi:MAG: hypothetical protein ACOC97_04200 [Myxococcota bacterium]